MTVGDIVSVKAGALSKGKTASVTTSKDVKRCELVVSDRTKREAAYLLELLLI